MSHDPTRKQFFGKLLGGAVAAGAVSRGLAKAAAAPGSIPAASPVLIRPETRAVARREGSA